MNPKQTTNTMLRTLTAFLILLLGAVPAFAQSDDVEARPEVTVTDASIAPGQTVHWTADNVYVLDGVVFVEDGSELHIEAGTVVKAMDGQGTNASALVVARGGKLYAMGRPDAPIIFTSIQDNISSPDLLTYESRGLWGGIVMLGRAGTNNPGDASGEYEEVEGVNELVSAGDTRAQYGGTDDNDSSGILRYVSIRHTGINIGESDGNEIQGLTLGGVGRGTVLEYIESFSSGDDGVEFFGGTVDLKYFVSAFNSDDAIDWDQGWRGNGQFWFVLQGTDKAGAAAEQDGAGGDEFFQPYAIPNIYNVTYVGAGVGAQPESDRAEMLMFRDNTGGFYHNSIFTDFQTDQGGYAITIEDIDNTGSKPEDSRRQFENGNLGLTHNLWWGFGAGNTPQQFVNATGAYQTAIIDYLVANGNQVANPMLRGVERSVVPGGTLDPRPAADSPAFSMALAAYPDNAWFTRVDYAGAFGRGNWARGWTALDDLGYFASPEDDVEARPEVTVTDASIAPGQAVHWTADNVYVLDGVVFVEDGSELHIEAGTVVKAMDGQGTNASALVVARGGKLYAMGRPDAPIIFTSIQDNISSPDLLTYESRGLWGGIVMLGRAGTNNPGDASGEYEEVEGVNELVSAGDTRAQYGGTDDNDSSGILRYVSIRHTGINIGESDGNEIQGLTLGGVGRGTVLEYIESFSSGDDGVEFFGGTVDLKYFVSAFNSDDAIDWDQGWRGNGQFWFVLQGTDKAGAAAEQDGAGGDEFFQPYAIPNIYNVTYVGAGVGAQPESDRAEMLMFRDNTGGFYHNSIFTDFQTDQGGYAITIEDIDNTGSKPEDSRRQFENGNLGLTHNLWWGFGAGNTPQQFVNATGAYQTAIIDYLVANGNQVVNPMLAGIDRSTMPSGGLDPRPTGNSPAFTSARATYPADPFFSPVDFIGAFGRDNWMRGWTALDHLGYIGDLATGQTVAVEELGGELPATVSLDQNYPNPFNPTTSIEFRLDATSQVRLSVHDVLGREVAVLIDGVQTAGNYRTQFDARGLASGTYLYRLTTPAGTVSKTMMLLK
jgi:hypothetical protein